MMTDFIQRYFKKDFDEYRRLYEAEMARQLKAKDDEYAKVLKAKDDGLAKALKAKNQKVNEAKAAKAAYALFLDNLRSFYRNGRIDLETAAMLLALPAAEAKEFLEGKNET